MIVRMSAIALSMALMPLSAHAQSVATNALPGGGTVTAGAAAIATSGNTLTVTQSTPRAVINWQNFNIGSGASVTFQQPGASSIILNRVITANPSTIAGSLSANGQVVLISPTGITVGGGASINAAGFIGSTLNITDGDFMAGNMNFSRNLPPGAAGSINNQGTIAAANGGYVALLAPQIANTGTIKANLGSVALASGDTAVLDLSGNGLLGVSVTPATVQSEIDLGGIVSVGNGSIWLSAGATNVTLGGAINATGVTIATNLLLTANSVTLPGSVTASLGGSVDVTSAVLTSGASTGIAISGTASAITLQPTTGSKLVSIGILSNVATSTGLPTVSGIKFSTTSPTTGTATSIAVSSQTLTGLAAQQVRRAGAVTTSIGRVPIMPPGPGVPPGPPQGDGSVMTVVNAQGNASGSLSVGADALAP